MDVTFWLIFAAGIVLGSAVTAWLVGRAFYGKPDGTLQIVQEEFDDEMTERYSFDFSTSLDDIPHRRFVIFRVKVERSHKNPAL